MACSSSSCPVFSDNNARAWMCLSYVWKILVLSVLFHQGRHDDTQFFFSAYILVYVDASCCFSPFLNYALFGVASTFLKLFASFTRIEKMSHLFIFLFHTKKNHKIPISPFVSCSDSGGAVRLITRWISPLYDKYWFNKKKTVQNKNNSFFGLDLCEKGNPCYV